jgi:Flp pilus assembly pilin Flp
MNQKQMRSVARQGAHRRTVFEEVPVRPLREAWTQFLRDESGTETLEWGLVCGLIVVGAIVVLTTVGPKITAMWNALNNAIPESGPGPGV